MPDLSRSPDDPARPASTGQQVYEGLKERLLCHEFRMGHVLREDEVAAWFDASRLPAREALKRLEYEGLIERSGRRYAVRHYDLEAVIVTYRMRAALEHLAVDLAMEAQDQGRLPPAAFAPLAQMLEAQRAAVDTLPRAIFSRLDAEFHLGIAALAGGAALLADLARLLDRIRLIRSDEILVDSGPLAALEDHHRILAALERGDGATAKAELNYHYSTTVRLHQPGGRPSSV
ncbi:GntR family transcriptional regulator [Pseudooceanicola sp. CBS1P-1]|uniref:FCD domain-containing protein n=1 Tax=Pseudooceanicola albus TaxID=2692189 RepID=A0A6L7G2F0_9RHOB|nr:MULTISPECIES: GntR family transcriptional regulator [Pseudooceanicola]MBT9383746.1 GntR family transcriptional regulator [Pseudooceanicola endophyticus]MXN17600.1 FCD domain-containing protein [Pseudooceanicola albus]